jgi:hypothetical protein
MGAFDALLVEAVAPSLHKKDRYSIESKYYPDLARRDLPEFCVHKIIVWAAR